MKKNDAQKAILVGICLAIIAVLILTIWVALDPTFIVHGDTINLIENPNFDDPERGFAGCATYARPKLAQWRLMGGVR